MRGSMSGIELPINFNALDIDQILPDQIGCELEQLFNGLLIAHLPLPNTLLAFASMRDLRAGEANCAARALAFAA